MSDHRATPPVLTEAQEIVLDFIRDFTADNGFAPTVREVTEALEWKSPSVAHDLLLRLKARGLVTWQERSPRTLRVLEGGSS